MTAVESKYKKGLVSIYLVCLCLVAGAGEVRRADVNYSGGAYFFEFEAVINSRFDTVHTIATDYEHLHQLSDAILESVFLDSPRAGGKRIRFVAQTCLLIFCFKKSLVVDIVETSIGVFNATTVPELCDFKSGYGAWHFTAAGESHTLVHYSGMQMPAFWIPPVIGPYLIKQKLVRESVKTIQKVEDISGNA